MIIYYCNHCQIDFGRRENEESVCFFCGSKEHAEFVRKEELTAEVLIERMKILANRALENLQKAYLVRPEDADEGELLDAMVRAKELKDKINQLGKN